MTDYFHIRGRYASMPILERLGDKFVFSPDGCWRWERPDGRYGRIWHEGRMASAHRLVYELVMGPIPEGLTLDHLCGNTKCVNPAHLEPVTLRENILRGTSPIAVQARQTHCKRGHLLAEDNLYSSRGGRVKRACRACSHATSAARRQRMREAT